MTAAPQALGSALRAALLTADPKVKAFAARQVARDWRLGRLDFRFDQALPDRPAWPERPELLAPRDMPKRGKGGSERGRIALWLVVTLLLGLAFLGFELRDFAHMVEIGAVPSRSGYLSAFWGLVPLHGAHVAAGCVWILVMLAQMATLGLVSVVKTRLLRLGLFWHFLDLVWIGIFTIVYLSGLAS